MDKTFAAIEKLKEVELELHRLKNYAEMMNRSVEAQREWQGLTDEEMSAAMDYWSDPVRSAYGGAHSADGEYVGMIDTWRYIEAKLKEKNGG
jgi:hypothetical protein